MANVLNAPIVPNRRMTSDIDTLLKLESNRVFIPLTAPDIESVDTSKSPQQWGPVPKPSAPNTDMVKRTPVMAIDTSIVAYIPEPYLLCNGTENIDIDNLLAQADHPRPDLKNRPPLSAVECDHVHVVPLKGYGELISNGPEPEGSKSLSFKRRRWSVSGLINTSKSKSKTELTTSSQCAYHKRQQSTSGGESSFVTSLITHQSMHELVLIRTNVSNKRLTASNTDYIHDDQDHLDIDQLVQKFGCTNGSTQKLVGSTPNLSSPILPSNNKQFPPQPLSSPSDTRSVPIMSSNSHQTQLNEESTRAISPTPDSIHKPSILITEKRISAITQGSSPMHSSSPSMQSRQVGPAVEAQQAIVALRAMPRPVLYRVYINHKFDIDTVIGHMP